MSAGLARKTIRERIRDRVLTVSGFSESPFHPQSLGRNPKNRGDKVFSVFFAATSEDGGRQRQGEGVKITYDCVVSYLIQIKPHTAVASYEDALDAEESIIQAIINPSSPLYTKTQIRYTSSSTAELTDTGEFQLTLINFTIQSFFTL